jgi:hypothetical protein
MRRVHLSPATLIVVPLADHMEHWRHQIQSHVVEGAAEDGGEGGEARMRVQIFSNEGAGWLGPRCFTTFTHSLWLCFTACGV